LEVALVEAVAVAVVDAEFGAVGRAAGSDGATALGADAADAGNGTGAVAGISAGAAAATDEATDAAREAAPAADPEADARCCSLLSLGSASSSERTGRGAIFCIAGSAYMASSTECTSSSAISPRAAKSSAPTMTGPRESMKDSSSAHMERRKSNA
jgi:hypothetical protein